SNSMATPKATVTSSVFMADLAGHPRFAGVDKAWLNEWSRPGVEFLAGIKAGSLGRDTIDQANALQVTQVLNEAAPGQGAKVTEMLKNAQQQLTALGLPNHPREFDARVGERTTAAFENAHLLYGERLEGLSGNALVKRLEGLNRMLHNAATTLGRELPSGRSGDEISGPVRDQLKGLVTDYQHQVMGMPVDQTTGVIDRATMVSLIRARPQLGGVQRLPTNTRPATADKPASRAPVVPGNPKDPGSTTSAPGTPAADTSKPVTDAEVSVPPLNHQLDSVLALFARPGAVGKDARRDAIELLVQMQEAGAADPKAKALFMAGLNKTASKLSQNSDVLASFVGDTAGMASDELYDSLVTQKVVMKLSSSQQQDLGRKLVEKGTALAGLPVTMLDILDSSFATVKMNTSQGAAEGVSLWNREVRDTLMSATVAKKEISALMHEDMHFLLNSSDAKVAAARISEVVPATGKPYTAAEELRMQPLMNAVGSLYNQKSEHAIEVLREVAKTNIETARYLISGLLRSDVLGRSMKADNFAWDIANSGGPLHNKFDDAFARELGADVVHSMQEQLVDGGYFDLGRTDKEEELSARLGKLINS
ncbi:hypothetical protein KAI87_07955, partial [Myxococcota bacterium]|nr:hypothetical protein [Myxococcota bacterium]